MATKKKKLPPLPGCLVNRQEKKTWDWETYAIQHAREVRAAAQPIQAEVRIEPPPPARGEWRGDLDGRVRFFPDPLPQPGNPGALRRIIEAFGENAGAEPNQILRDQP